MRRDLKVGRGEYYLVGTTHTSVTKDPGGPRGPYCSVVEKSRRRERTVVSQVVPVW